MGILRLALGEGTTMMKLLILLALLPSLWLRPSPRLMPIPTTDTTASATTVLDTVSVPTDTDTPTPTDTTDTTARGPLMPSPLLPLRLRLLLIPTTDTTALATMVLDTVPTVATTDTASATTDTATVCTDTTVRCPSNSSQPKTSLEIASRTSEKWIATFGLIPTSATVSVPPC